MSRRHLTILIAAVLAGVPAAPVRAQDAPSRALEQVEQDLAGTKKREAELAAKAKEAENELNALRARLIDAAESLRARETELQELEQTLAALEAQEAEQLAVLDADRARMARLLGMLERLSRVPPQALAARPDAPVDLVRSALLLRSAVPALRARAEELAGELRQIEDLRREIAAKRTQLTDERTTLAAQESELAGLVAQRESLHKKTEAERQKLAARMKELSGQAADLKDLMAKIEAERTREAEARAAAEAARRADEARVAALRAQTANLPRGAGGALLPAAGQIRLRYGQLDDVGATSRGLTIATRAGSTIVSPMAGTVMFAGPFKGYGQIVILEHQDGYHSLIAGVSRIDASVGQQVLAGEPIGRTGDGSEPTVYFELRKNGQPINPQLGL